MASSFLEYRLALLSEASDVFEHSEIPCRIPLLHRQYMGLPIRNWKDYIISIMNKRQHILWLFLFSPSSIAQIVSP